MMDEKQYDSALAAAYTGLKLSRQSKDDVLEIEAMRLLSTISMKLGNEFVGAKITQDLLLKSVEAIKVHGYAGWYKKLAATYIDFLKFDEKYLLYSFESDSPVNDFNKLVESFKEELAEAESDAESPPDRKRTLLFLKTRLESVGDKLARALATGNVKDLGAAYVEMAEVLEKGAEASLKFTDEEDREDAEMTVHVLKQLKKYLLAFLAKDKARAFAAIEETYRPLDEILKREGEGSLQEAFLKAFGEMQTELNEEGEAIFRQMFRVNSPKSNLNLYLLHFMKADKSLEPILERYGYLTFSELKPYKEKILEEGESVREQTKTGETVAMAEILPFDKFGLDANLIAVTSGASPESRWLYSENPALLFTAKEEIDELTKRTAELERRTRTNSDYARANLLMRRALVSDAESNPREALSYLKQALAIFRNRKDNELIWQTYFLMALLNKRTGNIPLAVTALKDSVETIEAMRSSFRSENIRSLVVEDRLVVYELLIDLLITSNDNAAALTYVEKTKARVLLDRFLDPRMKVIPGNLAPVRTVQTFLQRLHQLQQAKYEGRQVESLRDEALNESIAKENDKYLGALEELRYSNPEYAAIVSGEIVPIATTQKLLDDETLLLEYYVATEKTFIFLIDNKGSIHVASSNVSHLDLERKIQSFRERIEVMSDNYQALATDLYSLLIEPVRNRIQGKRICIVPHGASHFLPFHALMKDDRYLIQDHQIFYLPSASVLKYAFAKRRATTNRILIVADPAENLQMARQEAEKVAAVFSYSKLFLGREATKAKVMAAMTDAEIIHFATHAKLDKQNPLLSELALAEGSSLSVADVYGLELKANLVTLSACKTNLGRLTSGDEVIGLTRAFVFAGVPSLVTSLWETGDDSTSRLMVAFYSALARKGTTKAEAIRKAQVEMIKSPTRYSHPRNWAQFLLIGDFN
jgi:CHAT domain-containing protein